KEVNTALTEILTERDPRPFTGEEKKNLAKDALTTGAGAALMLSAGGIVGGPIGILGGMTLLFYGMAGGAARLGRRNASVDMHDIARARGMTGARLREEAGHDRGAALISQA